MTQPQNCVVCLSSDPKCFLDVSYENSDSPQKSLIIAKHLGFDLKPSQQSYACVDCWKIVYEFHLFYCKVKTIHNESIELVSTWNTDSFGHNDQEDLEFENYASGTVKAEPLKVHYDEEGDHEAKDFDNSSRHSSNSIEVTNERPKRNRHVVRYTDNLEFLEVGTIDPDLDEGNDSDDVISYTEHAEKDGLASDGTNHPVDAHPLANAEAEPVIVTPKRKRGRPPKQKIEQEPNPMKKEPQSEDEFNKLAKTLDEDRSVAVTPKKRRGRPPKKKQDLVPASGSKKEKLPRKSDDSMSNESDEEEQDGGSDFENSLSLGTLQKLSRSSSGLKGRAKALTKSPSVRDEKIFAYIDEFVCEYCTDKVTFKRFSEANRHYQEVHCERGSLKCPKCDKKTYTSGEFVSHMETHSNPDRCKCTVCGKMTDSEIALHKHMRCHQVNLEENLPFPCRQCLRRFELEEKRDKHELLHKPKPIVARQYGRDESLLEFYKRIYCDECEEANPGSTSFDNFWDLKVHTNKQHKKPPYLKCPLCFKKMGVRHQIMMHIDVHKNPELYRCDVCKEIHQYLDRHMIAAHTPSTTAPEKKRYNCEQCGRIFKFRWKLKYHINEAHGLKDVSCDVCKKFFTRPALAAHKRKAHIEGKANLLCDHCPKMYVTRHALRAHIAFAHENRRKQMKCNLCGKEVRSLKKHIQMVHPPEGPVNCDLCGKRFRAAFHMKRHRTSTCPATINSRPFKCEICGKGFSLKLTMTEHMTTHTRTNLYQCAFCLKTYGYLSNLQKQRKKAHPLEWQEVQGDHSIVTVIPINAPSTAE